MIFKRQKKSQYLSGNINYLLKQHNIDIKNLSAQTGIPAATIARMRKKGSNPTISTIEPLLDFFRVDMDTFLYKDMLDPEYQYKKQCGQFAHIPIVKIEDISNSINTSKVVKFVGAAGITGEKVFGVNITTEALAPAFQNNSIVIIDPDLNPKEGDYVLCRLEKDDKPVFRQIFIDGSKCFFKPINPDFGEIRYCKHFDIIGVVIKSIETYR